MKIEGKSEGILDASRIHIYDEKGNELRYISKCTIFMEAGDLVRAQMEILLHDISVAGALGEWAITDPRDGELRGVTRIEFDNGEVLDFVGGGE